MKTREQKIKRYWDEQAEKFKGLQLATAPDSYYRNLEIERIISYLKDKKYILDIGCGNGFSTLKFARKFAKAKFLGIDYSEKMIDQAKIALAKNKELKNRADFKVGNVLFLSRLSFIKEKFDYIISERCLINLLNWKEQRRALLEMKKVLKNSGRIILCENTQEGLARLNNLRKKQGLFPIKMRWHNCYMSKEKLLKFAIKYFSIEEVNNIGSLYYIISRVVYAKLCKLDNKNLEYSHPINKIASKLPAIGDYSPNYIFILKNKINGK